MVVMRSSPSTRHHPLTTIVAQQHSPPPSAQPRQPTTTPLVDAITSRANRTHEAPFHVPGHKRGSNPPPSLLPILSSPLRHDLTELQGLDYLSYPEGPIIEAQKLAAQAWGAHSTWFLVNGTTVGIHAAVLSTCFAPDATLILARNAHQSGYNAAALAGCMVEYAVPTVSHGLAHHMTPQALEEAFFRAEAKGWHPKAALIVSPTYFGVISDISGLAAVCHRHNNAVLIVDEAHGAHLHSIDPCLSSLHEGADIVIQSTHKQLGALTQGAMLHVSHAAAAQHSHTAPPLIDTARISRVLSVLQTSSPSYLIMASLDAARAQLQQDPSSSVVGPSAAAASIRRWFSQHANDNSTTKIRLLSNTLQEEGEGGESSPVKFDPWRCTLILQHAGRMTGWDLAAQLEEKYGVVCELAGYNCVVFAVGTGTTQHHVNQLLHALESVWKQLRSSSSNNTIPLVSPQTTIDVVLAPRAALLATSISTVAWSEAEGRISAELLCPYPPGIPAICPGERITRQVIEHLQGIVGREGGEHPTAAVVGAADPLLQTIRVIDLTSTAAAASASASAM